MKNQLTYQGDFEIDKCLITHSSIYLVITVRSEPYQINILSMKSPKILIVEDKKVLSIGIRESLQKLGYIVHGINDSGEKAIRKVAEINPNLVLIDICWKENIDALKTAGIIQENYQTPVLYLTDYSEYILPNESKLKEPFTYITKPFADKDLHIAVEMALYKHQFEQKLEQEKQWLTAIINSINSAVLVTDVNGRIQIMNPLAQKLSGYKIEEVVGEYIGKVLNLVNENNEEIITNLVAQVVSEGKVVNLPENCTLIAKDGKKIFVADSISPIYLQNMSPDSEDKGKITGTVLAFQDITERKDIEAQLTRNAFYDSLTGLPNRVLFSDRLNQAFERSKRHNDYFFAILFLDLDGFKDINDDFGHAMGDTFLIAIARRLESCLRSGDTVARLGGDEFVVLLEEIKDMSDATNITQRIQKTLKTPLYLNGHTVIATASIGITISSSHYQQPENLLRDADIAMYQAKRQGKAKYVIYNSKMNLLERSPYN